MNKIKVFIMAIMVCFLLALAEPGLTSGSTYALNIPPAVTFVRDINTPIMVKHNFLYDKGILVQDDSNVDSGFYVEIN